ncbi:GTP-dependent dephospho-CoA kinase family protein [Marine Group I thaumarchaeote]|uniref:GTP-dependent dephospho-CoA kinase n=1 Tax=Marine Group I thaumarchaeote TaxID=2511932 RepID=A0A7K4NSR9_9ARCH|nr:GTP-dependent dephospho-CoA kinase family protein [Marine Group I thaumarchaeote]
MQLPDDLRGQLKNPLGNLVSDNDPNKENIIKKISAESVLITVGDRTTENMLQLGLKPQIQIIDGLEKRNQRMVPIDDTINTKLSCKNPPGEITEESIQVIKKAFSSEPPVRIIVDGEEDLLVIPACISAPENSVVMYGQPNEGLVIVTITPEIRAKVQKILDAMN